MGTKTKTYKCSACNGRGYYTVTRFVGNSSSEVDREDCDACNGSGIIVQITE